MQKVRNANFARRFFEVFPMVRDNRGEECCERKLRKSRGVFRVGLFFAAAFAIFVGVFARSSPANAVACLPMRNSFIISQTAVDAEVVSATITNKVTNATPYGNQNGVTPPTPNPAVNIPASGWVELPAKNSAVWFSGDGVATGSFFFPVSQFSPNDTITIRFKNAATYNGKTVDILETWSNIISRTGAGSIQIAKRFYSGEFALGIFAVQVNIKVVEPGSTTPLTDFTNSYLTVLSLNPGQITKPLANIPDVTLSDDTAIVQIDTAHSGLTGAYTGGDSNWTDKLGSDTFHRGAVQYSLDSADFSFYNGSDLASPNYWASNGTALLVAVCPDAPVKVADARIAKLGDKINYQISQITQILGSEILANYQNFAISDRLDSRLKIDPAQITVTVGGEDQTSNFAIDFDETSRELTVVANATLLASTNFYGREVVFNVPAKITGEISADVPIKNRAAATIDGNEQETNEVIISAIVSPTPTATPTPISQRPTDPPRPGAPSTAIVATSSIFAILAIGSAIFFATKKLSRSPKSVKK